MRFRFAFLLLAVPLAALLAFSLRARDTDVRDGAIYVIKLKAGG